MRDWQRAFGVRPTQTKAEKMKMKQREKQSQAKEYQEPPEARRGKKYVCFPLKPLEEVQP